jgi:hypothetical protein
MKIPKNTNIRVDTENGLIELHIIAAITTKTQARELSDAIMGFEGALDGEDEPVKRKRKPRKPRVVGGTAVAEAGE